MRPGIRKIDFQHRLNGYVIKAHLRYIHNPDADTLLVTYVVDHPVYSQNAKDVYTTFQEEILGRLATDMDSHNIPHLKRTRIVIMPGFLPVPFKP